MNTAKEYKTLETTLDIYRNRLDTIADGQFDLTPPDGGWSYAEVYSHILQATLMSFIGMDRCIGGNVKPAAGGPNFLGKVVLFTGRFPPVKIKVPQSVASKMPPQKITKEEAKNLIMKCRKRIEETHPQINGAPAENRSKHPRLGMLNAAQWFKFIRIHLQHHIKQLNRIQKALQ